MQAERSRGIASVCCLRDTNDTCSCVRSIFCVSITVTFSAVHNRFEILFEDHLPTCKLLISQPSGILGDCTTPNSYLNYNETVNENVYSNLSNRLIEGNIKATFSSASILFKSSMSEIHGKWPRMQLSLEI